MKAVICILFLFVYLHSNAQTCDCEKEFLFIKKTIEQNFAGYPDRIKALTKKAYDKKVAGFLQLIHNKFASDNCPLIISQYLNLFKSHHLGFAPHLDFTKIDTDYVNHRPLYNISDEQLARLRQSRSWEGIYNFTYDTTYKIAVIKDATPLHDYIGVTLASKLPTWKKGMIKFEGKLVNDSTMMGLLYMRNHRPKLEGFGLWDHHNKISGDWLRDGAVKVEPVRTQSNGSNPPPVYAKKLSDKTLYLKIVSFDTELKPMVDSVLHANESLLNTLPNLVLDLRDNGGGSDNVWWPLVSYLYTGPIKSVGLDVLATEQNINGWKKYLEDENISAANRNDIQQKISLMEKGKGKWVNIGDDDIDSSMTAKLFPKKVVILINKWCGSSTEELLLLARQSSKVILAGQPTIGNLDYSNVVEMPFSCFPYILRYASTRSRRLDIHQGIDNVGIQPQYFFKENEDWRKEEEEWIQGALKILEQ